MPTAPKLRARPTAPIVTRAAFALIAALGCAAAPSCTEHCAGVEIDGRCETLCEDALCPAGSSCVSNACARSCTASTDCPAEQRCASAVADYGGQGMYCAGTRGTAGGRDGASCERSSECDGAHGYRCVSGSCTLTCEIHEHCASRGSCTAQGNDSEGKEVALCEDDGFSRGPGQYGSSCALDDGACDADTGFRCIGAGQGDADAYCTQLDCGADADCPSGYYCSTQVSSRRPCEAGCGFEASDRDGCVPKSEIGSGQRFRCGPAGGLHFGICLRRGYCNECETDVDCRGRPHQVCAKDGSGNKICTILCDPGVNSCPWGSASVCRLWDEQLGIETCGHRFGSCTGDGSGCHPCIDQGDCPRGECVSSAFTGERFCIDHEATCTCNAGAGTVCTGGGCPSTPAGSPMSCYGGDFFIGTQYEGLCIGISTARAQLGEPEGCWPSF